MVREKPGQTLQATALVHEAYLRLLGTEANASFANRRHFFAAAAEAMRRILIEQTRRKQCSKRGGDLLREELVDPPVQSSFQLDLLELSEALDRLAARDPLAAELVKLKFFAGMTTAESAQLLEMSERSTERLWVYAKSFLHKELLRDDD